MPFTVTITLFVMHAGYVVITSFVKLFSNSAQHPSESDTQSLYALMLKQNGDESTGVDQSRVYGERLHALLVHFPSGKAESAEAGYTDNNPTRIARNIQAIGDIFVS
jgi:hypothetical protein